MGVAETMVDKKITNSMKKRGMCWSRTGAAAMASLLMLRSNGELVTWLDEQGEDDILNPIKKLRNLVKETSDTVQDYCKRVSVPALYTAIRPWAEALRALSGF
jgi:hypothetical protein